MAFTKVEKLRTGGHGVAEATITMGAYLADGKKHKSKYVNFRISRTLLNQLGWVPKENKLYLSVNEGSGNDRGFLQLVNEEHGRRVTVEEATNQGASTNVAVESFKHYVLNECPVSTETVSHTVDGSTLIVECPDWLRFNPQSEPEPKSTPVTQLHRTRRQRG